MNWWKLTPWCIGWSPSWLGCSQRQRGWPGPAGARRLAGNAWCLKICKARWAFEDRVCDLLHQQTRQGPRFSIRMIIWIFCSDTLWWLCVFLLVQQSYFQRVRRQCCLAISSSLWHSSAYKVLARLTKSLLLRPILCRPVAMMICIQKTFGWYEFKEEMAIFLERQTDGKRANSFGLCLIALNLNSFFPFFMTKCTFFLLNSEMWNENHCFNKKVCNCLLNNFLNPSPQDIGLLFIPTQLLQHSLLNIMRRINQDLAQVGSMDQTIWLLRTLSW